jgi:ferrochelatase
MSKAILLVNLGSPDSPSVPDVRRYLNQFLMDGRVIDTAWPVRRLVVGMILISRPKESGHAYEKIWTKEGSPLVVISKHVQALLQQRVSVPVELAMRYQNPTIESAVKSLAAKGATKVLLIPLFPHYAMSSYESAVMEVVRVAGKIAPQMELTVQPPYYDRPDYIAALVASAADYLKPAYDHLLFSFHGIPERHIRKSDTTGCHCLATPNCCETPSPAHAHCYRAQCYRTASLFAEQAGVPAGKWSVSFQSRLEADAGDLSGVRLGLFGDDRRDRDAWVRTVSGGQREGVHADSVPERASAMDRGAGNDGAEIPGAVGTVISPWAGRRISSGRYPAESP